MIGARKLGKRFGDERVLRLDPQPPAERRRQHVPIVARREPELDLRQFPVVSRLPLPTLAAASLVLVTTALLLTGSTGAKISWAHSWLWSEKRLDLRRADEPEREIADVG